MQNRNRLVPSPIAACVALAVGLSCGARTGLAGPQERGIALEIVKLVTPREAYKDMLKQMTENMSQAMAARGGNAVTPEKNAQLVAALEEALPYDDLIQWTADIYAARFSVAELKELRKFYQTPLGRKLAKSLPDIMGETGKKVGTVIPQRLPEALKKHGLTP